MDAYEPQRKRRLKARERQAARQGRRRESMTGRHEPPRRSRSSATGDNRALTAAQTALGLLVALLGEARWYLANNPIILRSAAFIGAAVFLLYLLSFPVSGRIFPNVSTMGVGLGGMSLTAAEDTLRDAWADEIEIALLIGNEIVLEASPETLGFRLDAPETARAARAVGLGALPFGREIEPVVTVDRLTAQSFLLEVSDSVEIRPYDAGYDFNAGQVVGVPGSSGRMLDVPMTIERLMQDAQDIVARGRVELLMITLPPDTRDPSPYLETVQQLATEPLRLHGYDPFTNQHLTWQIEPETYVPWLAAGLSSLTLRENEFVPFLSVLNESLNSTDGDERFLAQDETTDAVRQAILDQRTDVSLRIRYRPTTYEVVRGDTLFGIARKTGIPFFLIEELNPGRDLDRISPGDTVNIPSRDVVMPQEPVSNKRIIVNLDTQYLVAFERGEVVFEWPISTGVSNAPTSPGTYQILNHSEVAYGSSALLCNTAGLPCGRWEMNWFMGIYEVRTGLVNGFHGMVRLPNGGLLGDGSIGFPSTFGCIMSSDANAQLLYEWAEVGTVVEIISREYAPVSDLARLTVEGST